MCEMSNKHENGEEVERDGVREEEERRDRGESMTDSEASAPSEFDISSTEVDRLLESQGKNRYSGHCNLS